MMLLRQAGAQFVSQPSKRFSGISLDACDYHEPGIKPNDLSRQSLVF